jgi:hypothetical protein
VAASPGRATASGAGWWPPRISAGGRADDVQAAVVDDRGTLPVG